MATNSSDILRRNKRIVKFFKQAGINIRLIGRPDKPAIIWNDAFILSAYAHNFNLRFTDIPRGGSVVKEYKLKVSEKPNPSEIVEILNACEHKPVYKIQYGLNDMYLAGYNFLDKENGEGRYPVFAKHQPKLYYSKTKAQEICSSLEEDSYRCVVVEPVVNGVLFPV